KMGQSIQIEPRSVKLSQTTVTLPQLSSEGLTVSYTSSNPAVATVSGNTVTLKTAGVTTISGAQAGDNSHEPAVPAAALLTVLKGDQTISLEVETTKTLSTPYTLTGATSSGLTLTYESSAPDKASVSGNVVTFHKAGDVIITASQDGDAN